MGEYICNSSHRPKLRTVCYTKAARGVDHDAGRGRDLHDAGRRRCRIAGVIAVVEQASGTTFEVRPTHRRCGSHPQGGADMADRENSPAYAALSRSARRVFAAIQQAAIGDGSSASVSYVDFRLDRRRTGQ